MSTIFGASWPDLTLDHVKSYLDRADDEPLLWEAKGTRLDAEEVRRQVCAFANSHEGGYLILGAARCGPKSDPGPWILNGLAFPGGEPRTWISDVVADPTVGVRPLPRFDVTAWAAPSGHVAVVEIESTSTPPCIANGTVYERLPGKSQPVRDPLRLAELFARGDTARRDAQARADEAARAVLVDGLGGDAGLFAHPAWVPLDDPTTRATKDAAFIQFAVGVAATGNSSDIASRLFRHEFSEAIWLELGDRPTGAPPGFGRPPDPVVWAQNALTWRHQMVGLLNDITIVRATWDGAVASGQRLATEHAYPDSLAVRRIGPEWERADDLVRRLGGFGEVYVTVLVAGGRFPRRTDEEGYIIMRRGPMQPGVDDEQVASLGRELMRALGSPEEEPEP